MAHRGSQNSFTAAATALLMTSRRSAEAIRYAVEDLRTPRALGAWMQVGDEPVWSKDMWLPKITRRYEV